jgi:hypothetical protein
MNERASFAGGPLFLRYTANCHQSTLNSKSLPPVKFRYRSRVPVAPLTGQLTSAQVCQPPVLETVHLPTTGPLGPSTRSSI